MNFPDRPQIFPVPIQKFPVLPFRELALEARGIPGMLASRIELDRRQNREIPCIFPWIRENYPHWRRVRSRLPPQPASPGGLVFSGRAGKTRAFPAFSYTEANR